MKKLNDIATTIIFLVLIFGLTAATLLTPKKDFSENENRTLVTDPKFSADRLFKGEFATAYETYLADQFVLRDKWIAIKTLSEMALLKKDINGVYLADDNYLIEIHDPEDKAEPIDSEKAKKNSDRMIEFVKKCEQSLGEGHAKAMIVPTAVITLSDKLPAFATTYDQKALIGYIEGRLGNSFVNVSDTLKSHSEDYIYYKTDHHWTMAGAYYAYEQWAEEIGLTPYKMSDFDIETVKDFKGTIYSKINFAFETDTLDIYRPKFDISYEVTYEKIDEKHDSLYELKHLETKDKYQVYLDGNHSVTRIDTDLYNGRVLLIIKDSYANAFATLAANHFETTYMVDFRYFRSSISEFIEENGVTDVLVLYNAIHFSTDNYSALFEK